MTCLVWELGTTVSLATSAVHRWNSVIRLVRGYGMAENYDAAIRRRLGIINDMGASATGMMQRQVASGGQTMRQPGFQSGQPMRMMSGGAGGQQYTGPRGNQQALINFGKYLQSQGFKVSENSYFNGGRRITSGH